MKFNNWSDELACGKAVSNPPLKGEFACLRAAWHEGECIAMAREAGQADGVCFSCRQKIDQPHRADCIAMKGTPP